MKIVLAFDSFKGCISATEACKAAAEAIKCNHPEYHTIEIPMSDGGEGLVRCVANMLDVVWVHMPAHGPLMEGIEAEYILSPDGETAYMEMAATSGLPLVPPALRNPMQTTTYGVGEMIADATRRGCKQIIMGIGGSATNDGGKGMLTALRDLGIDYKTIPPITAACDVTNPLCGPNGASVVFGPQKGATTEMVQILDTRLKEFAGQAIAEGIATPEMIDYPGAGAAGGLGFGLMAYLHAELKSGIDILMDIAGFDEKIQGADLVITGEGKSDEQTLMGKVPHGVLRRCQKQGIPVHLYSGAIDDPNNRLKQAFAKVISINEGDRRPLDELLRPEVALTNLRKCFLT